MGARIGSNRPLRAAPSRRREGGKPVILAIGNEAGGRRDAAGPRCFRRGGPARTTRRSPVPAAGTARRAGGAAPPGVRGSSRTPPRPQGIERDRRGDPNSFRRSARTRRGRGDSGGLRPTRQAGRCGNAAFPGFEKRDGPARPWRRADQRFRARSSWIRFVTRGLSGSVSPRSSGVVGMGQLDRVSPAGSRAAAPRGRPLGPRISWIRFVNRWISGSVVSVIARAIHLPLSRSNSPRSRRSRSVARRRSGFCVSSCRPRGQPGLRRQPWHRSRPALRERRHAQRLPGRRRSAGRRLGARSSWIRVVTRRISGSVLSAPLLRCPPAARTTPARPGADGAATPRNRAPGSASPRPDPPSRRGLRGSPAPAPVAPRAPQKAPRATPSRAAAGRVSGSAPGVPGSASSPAGSRARSPRGRPPRRAPAP